MATVGRRRVLGLAGGLVVAGLAALMGRPAVVQGTTPLALTPAGCCPAARWLPDSRQIVFYHRPADGPAGAWVVEEGGTPRPHWPRFGHISADGSLIVSSESGATLVERLDGSSSQTLDNGGIETLPAPDGQAVAYLRTLVRGGRTNDSQERVVVARLDGSPAQGLLDLARADYLSWFPDSRRLVVFGWRPEGTSPGLWVIDSVSGQAQQIVAANFLTAIAVSPNGEWIGYLATLQPTREESGVWIVRPDGSDRRRLPHERAFRWASDSQSLLALMPAPGGKEIHRIEIATGQRSVVIGRDQADFDVEADDWSIAPDGHAIVYRSSRDRGLWLLPLPRPATTT